MRPKVYPLPPGFVKMVQTVRGSARACIKRVLKRSKLPLVNAVHLTELECSWARALRSNVVFRVKVGGGGRLLPQNAVGDTDQVQSFELRLKLSEDLLERLIFLDEISQTAEKCRKAARGKLQTRSAGDPPLDDIAGFSGDPVLIGIRYGDSVLAWALRRMQSVTDDPDELQAITNRLAGVPPFIPDRLLRLWRPALLTVHSLADCPPEMTDAQWNLVLARLQRLTVRAPRVRVADQPLSTQEQKVWDALNGRQLTNKQLGAELKGMSPEKAASLVHDIRLKKGPSSIRTERRHGYWREDAPPPEVRRSPRKN